MQFFNIGALELIFIFLLAFIVLGPNKALKAAGDVGRWVRNLMNSQFWKDIVSTSKEIQELPKKMMDDAEIQRTIEELERSTGELKATINQNRSALHEDLSVVKREFQKPRHIHPDPAEETDGKET